MPRGTDILFRGPSDELEWELRLYFYFPLLFSFPAFGPFATGTEDSSH